MTVWVIRDGELVEKADLTAAEADRRSIFPCPSVSRMPPFESPVTGKEITSWRERDADMKAVDAVDIRDLPKDHQFKRGRAAQLKEIGLGRADTDPFWRDLPV